MEKSIKKNSPLLPAETYLLIISILIFDFRWSNDEFKGHRIEAFFRDVTGNALSTVHFSIKINKNVREYFLNVTLSYNNNRNKYISTASSKKIIENVLFL